MFMILYHHSRIYHPKEFWYLFFGGDLYSGVSLFFFISGVGLTRSYNTNKYTILQFFQKRFLAICIGVALCIYARSFSSFLWGGTFHFPINPLEIFGLHEWYIVAILIWYILFIIIMKTQRSQVDIYFYTFLAMILTWSILSRISEQSDIARLWARFPFSFAVGVVLADRMDIVLKYCRKRALVILLICGATLAILINNGSDKTPYALVSDFVTIPLALATCSIFYTSRSNDRLFLFMGKYSLYLYLTQALLLQHSFIYNILGCNIISLILTWLTIFTLSWTIGYTHRFILQRIPFQ